MMCPYSCYHDGTKGNVVWKTIAKGLRSITDIILIESTCNAGHCGLSRNQRAEKETFEMILILNIFR